jgi:hypothetical protein
MIAAWIDWVATGPEIQDPAGDSVREAARLSGRERTEALLRLVDAELAEDAAVVELVHGLTAQR